MVDREYQQLQFDISEKVRLHPQQPGIRTLVELDLYPDVEIEDQETHLRIHGYLRLAGKYVGDEEDRIDEREERIGVEGLQTARDLDEIAYVIPVEITLPSDRVDMDRIAAEVESFDYRVLSPFELQIEAVLTIDGLLSDSKKDAKTSSDGDVSFAGSSVHSEKGTRLDPEEEELPGEVHLIHVDNGGTESKERAQGKDVHVLAEESSAIGDEGEYGAENGDEAYLHAVESSSSGESPAEEWSPDPFTVADGRFREDEGAKTPEKADGEKSRVDDGDFPAEDHPTSRVRFGIQPQKEDRDEEFQLAGNFLRKPSPDEFGPDRSATDPSAEMAGEASGTEEEAAAFDEAISEDERDREPGADKGEGLHWSRQFLGAREDTFVKMRMVIVQRGESVESLAGRYGVSISSILRLNGLDSGQLEEGQIVYIPGEERKTAQ